MARTTVTAFSRSLGAYETWLRKQLRGDLWEDDLALKHEQMRSDAFVFLRATYWRWAESILAICPDLASAPLVTGVGDVHLENYGVWRDVEGRLTWGVNDLDEAAEMPYAIDLVRLATSAILCRVGPKRHASALCAEVLDGYLKGLARPRPFSLDEKRVWLRSLFVVSEDERARFWKKIDKLDPTPGVPRPYAAAIARQMPGADCVVEQFARRPGAGVGSLGRPRWVGIANWRGGRVVREAKAIVPSAWTVAHRMKGGSLASAVAGGRYRAQDPWYAISDRVVVRRLSPNTRKIEAKEHARQLVDGDMLHAMGHELANIHQGCADVKRRIEKDLAGRRERWLERASGVAAEFVADEFKRYVRS